MESGYITKIKIHNVRHLQNIDIPLATDERKHLIITGKNGSGKTSLLEAVRLFLWLLSDDAYTSAWILSNQLNDIKDPLKYQFETKKIIPTIGSLLNYQGKDKFLEILKKKSGVDVTVKGLDWNKFRLDPNYYVIAYYPAERTYSETIEKVDRVTFKDTDLIYDHPGKDFVKYLKELKSQEALFRNAGNKARADEIKLWMDKFTDTLRKIFDNVYLNVIFDIETMTFFIEEPGKNPFAFDELSSGYAAILDIITDLMMRMEKKVGTKYDMPGFVLIDEVDAHLHLSLQKNILPTLTQLFPNLQFIVTTHSPFVLNSIANVIVYNLETNTLVNSKEGLSKLPYSGIVEGYFGVSELSFKLKKKFERYKELSKKPNFTDDDYNELSDLENYLDEIPDFLALDIMADYQQIKWEISQREEVSGNNG